MYVSAKYILYAHNEFNDWVPQRLEVDEQHCNEVTQRDLEENRQKKDTKLKYLSCHVYICTYMYCNLLYTLQDSVHLHHSKCK